MNKIFLHGKLGRDPEISYSQSGTAICKFSIATYNGKDKDPTWHNIVAFKKNAELITEHFKKGSEIIVEGKQENSKYEKDDKTVYYSSVILFSFNFCGSKNDQDNSPKQDNHIPDDQTPF